MPKLAHVAERHRRAGREFGLHVRRPGWREVRRDFGFGFASS
jgi:hypothetical protein